jgi:putative hydrolase of the HAD superfamily
LTSVTPSPSPYTPRAVFFDVGETLVHVHPSVGEVYARVAKRHGVVADPAAVQQRFNAAWSSMVASVPRGANRYRVFPGGEIGWWREVVRCSFAGMGFDPQPHFQEFFDAFSGGQAWRQYPEASAVLDDLAARGLRLGVISNWDSRLPALLEALGLRRYFSTIVYSAAEDIEKPAAEIFRRAARRGGVEPARALHVGDRLEEDYRGARAAGMRALLVDRGGKARGQGIEAVGDLTQIAEHLE